MFSPPPQFEQNRRRRLQQHLQGLPLLPAVKSLKSGQRDTDIFDLTSSARSRSLITSPIARAVRRSSFSSFLQKIFMKLKTRKLETFDLLCNVSLQVPVRFPGSKIDKVQLVNDFCVLEN